MLKRWLSRFLTTTFATTMLLGNIVQARAAEQRADIYLNPRASVEDRVNDLMSKMTLDDKIGQMVQAERKTATPEDVKNYNLGSILSGGGSLPTPNTPESWADMIDGYQKAATSSKLGIPILYGVDAVHGHNNVYGATIFPHNIALGATGDATLVRQIGQSTAAEIRATGVNWTFAPFLGIPQNERWGRTPEAFGENSEIVTKMGEAFVRGLQGDIPDKTLKRSDKVIATAKHYIGEGLTTDGKNQGDVVLSEAELQKKLKEELLPPYKAAVDAGVRSVMVSYNSINGEKCHGNVDLITKTLKGDLGFSGIVVSDWEGIAQLPGTDRDKIKAGINAGIDMAMVPNSWKTFIPTLKDLVQKNEVTQSRIDDAVKRILKVKFEMGLFEDPYAQRDLLKTVGSTEHREQARAAVRESLVLLKNDNDIVGKLKDKKNILVAGKNADDIGNQCGGWTISWQGSSGNTTPGTTILQGIKNTVGSDVKVTYNKRGRAAQDNDVAVVVIGETPYAESDGDRTPDALKLDQDDLTTIQNIKSTNPNLPIVAVLVTGRPITIADQLEDFDGLVEAWLPGTEGQGVADVLFGNYDFNGKLTITWPWYAEDIPTKHDAGKALFNYGYGLKKGNDTLTDPYKLPAKPERQETTPAKVISGTDTTQIEAEDYVGMSGFTAENVSDVGGGKDLGYTDAGDWTDYYVNVEKDGQYKVQFRVASPDGSSAGAQLYLGSKQLTKVDVTKTGGWQNWTTVEGTANLKAGKQTLRFKAGNSGFNINWLSFTRIGDIVDDGGSGSVEPYNPTGNVIQSNAVDVWMSSSEQSGSMSWYDAPKEISNTLTKKPSLNLTAPDNADVTTINIDDSKTYQKFLGMGTSLEESSINNIAKMSPEVRHEFLKKLVDPVNGAGMSLMRITIGTADFTGRDFYTYYDTAPVGNPDWYNTSGKGFSIQKDIDYNIIATVKEVLEINPNVKFFASSWTPPGWMKEATDSSRSYSDNDKLLKGGKLSDDHIDDLAMYYTRYLEEYAKQGIPLYAMTLQNEPELEINYPSCRMTAAQEQRLAISLKRHVSESFVLNSKNTTTNPTGQIISPKVWAFDHNFSSGVSFASQVYNNDAGKAAVDGIAFHDYGGEPTAMTQVHNMFEGKSVNLTERSVWGTKGADRIAQYFRNYAESYNSWVTMLDSNISPEQWTGTPDPTMFVEDANDRDNYWATPEYYITGQFSKFIEQGAVRIDSNYGSSDTVTNVAFKNPDGSIVVVVINQTEQPQNFKLLNNGVQVGGTIPAGNVATYKWNPIASEKINQAPGTFSATNYTSATDNVKVEGDHIGYLNSSTYVDYLLDVKEAGLYNVSFQVANPYGGDKSIVVSTTDGTENKTLSTVKIGQTSWSTPTDWNTYSWAQNSIKLDKTGLQKIRLNINGEFNIKGIKFEKVKEVQDLPGRIQAENVINSSGVIIENGHVGYFDPADFVEYKVNVQQAGEYTFKLNITSSNTNPSFDVYSNGTKIGDTITLNSTGGWSNWQTQAVTLTLPAGEQTIRFVDKVGFDIDWFSVGPVMEATSDIITEGSLNGKEINVNIEDGEFALNLDKNNWIVSNLPAGVDFDVVRVDNTNAKIVLKGEATNDFDSNKLITISMAAKELVSGQDKTYSLSDNFVINAVDDKEELSAASNIDLGTSSVILTLAGGEFKQDKVNDITLSGDMVTNGYVSKGAVEYINSTQVKINLNWGAKYYEDLPLTVNVPVSAYGDSTNGVTISTDIICNKSTEEPKILNVSDSPTTLSESDAYRKKGSLASDVQVGNRLDFYLNIPETGDYTITYTIKNNSSITNAIKVTKGEGLNPTGNLVNLSLTNFYNNSLLVKDTVNLDAGKQTLRIEANNTGFTISSIQIQKKSAPQVIKADNPGDMTTINADTLIGGSREKGYTIETKNNIKDIGSTVVGSYMDYYINVAKTGKYLVSYNYATASSGAPAAVLQDGTGKQLARTVLSSTGDWNAWADSKDASVNLTQGIQVLRVYVDGDGFNLRSLSLKYIEDNTAPVITGNDARVEINSKVDFVKALGINAMDDFDGDITSKVVVDSSKVNLSKLGDYEVNVSATDSSGNKATKKFNITVVQDATPPVIEGKSVIIPVGYKFDAIKTLGIKVTDNRDGDITSIAQITHVVDTSTDGVFRVKVSATDKAGNSSERIFVVRVISQGVIDTSDITLTVGDSFNPLTGVKAYDLTGEDITSKIIIVSNNVDTSKAGTYKVVYKITDCENTVVTKERVVTVKNKPTDPGNGGNPTPGDNGSKPTTSIITDENGNKVVVVTKLNNKDGKNVIEVPNGQKGVFVEISDIDSIKNGTGSLEIKNDSATITLPFSAIDRSFLTTGSKVVLNLTLEEGSDLTKHIKGLNRVFNFNLFVVNGDKKVQIHNFAKGEAEVSLTLSDSEVKALNMNNIGVFYYNESTGKFELMDTRVDGNKVIFKTKHFSKFIIAEVSQSSNGVLPKTGSDINTNNIIFLGMIMLLSGAFLVTRRKKDSEA